MKDLQLKLQTFVDKPTSESVYTLKDKQYRVVSHYVGEKDVDAVLLDLAKKSAYEKITKKATKKVA